MVVLVVSGWVFKAIDVNACCKSVAEKLEWGSKPNRMQACSFLVELMHVVRVEGSVEFCLRYLKRLGGKGHFVQGCV